MDGKLLLLIIGTIVVVVGLVFLSVRLREAEAEECRQAGGKLVCHEDTYSGIDSKGRPTVGTVESCRCLRADGTEVVSP